MTIRIRIFFRNLWCCIPSFTYCHHITFTKSSFIITQKLYFSPVLDGFNSEIIAYNLSTSPNLEQVKAMLDQAFTEEDYENTILHSDQGWQYQHQYYHQFLESTMVRTASAWTWRTASPRILTATTSK